MTAPKTIEDLVNLNEEARDHTDVCRREMAKIFSALSNIETRLLDEDGATAKLGASFVYAKEQMSRFSDALSQHDQKLLDEWRVLNEKKRKE